MNFPCYLIVKCHQLLPSQGLLAVVLGCWLV
jgi:hypothetical protein